jgi:tetratricopeptide (TPR) repeat protein
MDLTDRDFDGIEPTREELTKLGIRLVDVEGRAEAALKCFEILLAQDPWDGYSLNNKAHCLRALKRVEEARETVFSSITITPKLAEGWCTLGEIQALAGERLSASLSFELALRLAKDTPLEPAVLEHMVKLSNM